MMQEPPSRRSARGFRVGISTALVGDYNVSNCLAALALALWALALSLLLLPRASRRWTAFPAEWSASTSGQDFTAIVDFAHTPNALKVTLEARADAAAQVHVQQGAASSLCLVLPACGIGRSAA